MTAPAPPPLTLAVAAERWPIAGSFTISRGAKTEAAVVVAELGDGRHRGRGECTPYARYNESVDSVIGQIEAMRPLLARGLDRAALQRAMPPGDMAAAAAKAAQRALLKVKLGAPGDAERIAAVRAAAPATTLIVDANEGWTADNLAANVAACAKAGVVLIEQPLPEGRDAALAGIERPVPICADESAHDLKSL